MASIFSGITGLEHGLEASWLRNRTILHNIANNDTPYFKGSAVNFESLYRAALDKDDDWKFKQTRATHRSFNDSADPDDVRGVVVAKDATTYRMDENNVDIDQETTDYAKNYIYYNALLRKVNGQFSQLNSAIKGQ